MEGREGTGGKSEGMVAAAERFQVRTLYREGVLVRACVAVCGVFVVCMVLCLVV